MSTVLLHLIPRDHLFVPTIASAESARTELQTLMSGDEATSTVNDRVMYFSTLEGDHSISCPYCNQLLDDQWFGEQMEAADQTEFVDLSTVTPCCGRTTSLNDLTFSPDEGFARYELSVWNVSRALEDEEITALERTLGTSLRQVLAVL